MGGSGLFFLAAFISAGMVITGGNAKDSRFNSNSDSGDAGPASAAASALSSSSSPSSSSSSISIDSASNASAASARGISAKGFASDAGGHSMNEISHSASGPPLAEKRPFNEPLHGVEIVDDYRWLEDGTSPDVQRWVEKEMAYTRKTLDPLPGREAIHKRLTELLSIGSITPPSIAGKYYFYTRREGMQNQPVLYVREAGAEVTQAKDGAKKEDRVLVDANAMAADGTIALDWYQPSQSGKYVAYGTSPSGSEMSTPPHCGDRDRQGSARCDRPDAGVQHCLAARRFGILLHKVSEEG